MPRAGAERFVRHLRDLARAHHEPVRDVAACPQVRWLSELPGEVHVETEAAPGDVLFSVPVIPITPPAALEEFDSWLALRRWYRALRALAAGDQGDETGGYELVLGTGLLTIPEAGVRSHLLTTPVQTVVDPQTERIDVVVADRPPVLHDRELLEGVGGFLPERTEWVRDSVHAGQGLGLQDSVTDVLRKWCAYAFGEPVGFREDWTDDQASGAARVRLAPALVLRPRGRRALLDHLDWMLAELAAGTAVPPALADFVAGTGRSGRRLAYLPGRTPEAVADLLGALLASGRRVLVTTVSPAASAELLAALPSSLRPLCVTPQRLAECRSALSARAAEHDPVQHDRHLAGLQQRLTAVHAVAEDLRLRIQTVRAAEVHDLAPGYRGTVAELAARLAADADRHGWLPPAERLPETTPLSAGEAAELLGLLTGRTPERAARTAQSLPEPSALPVVASIRKLAETERAAREQAARGPLPELSAALAGCPAETLGRLTGTASAVATAIGELGLPPDPARWDPDRDWAVRAVRDGLARRTGAWDHVAELAVRAAEAERAARFAGTGRIVLPPLPEGMFGLPAARYIRERLPAVSALRDHLAAGASLRRGPLRPAVQKAAEPVLAGAAVDDEPPATAEHLDLVMAGMQARAAVHELVSGWLVAGVAFPVDRPLSDAVAGFTAAYARLGHVRTALLAVTETASLLFAAGLRVPLGTPEEWQAYTAALAAVRPRLAADRATAALSAVEDLLQREIRKGQEPPELHSALAAVQRRDAEAYGRCLVALSEAHGERLVEARCAELHERVSGVHPALAELMAAEAGHQVWTERLRGWAEAWAWARASAALRDRPRPAAELHYERELEGARQEEALLAAELAAEQAWGAALARRGQPAWLVPLWQVPDAVPAAQGPFDAVIVDQGAAADEEALFLLWSAPRLIITGPPEHGPFRDALEDRLGPAGSLLSPGRA